MIHIIKEKIKMLYDEQVVLHVKVKERNRSSKFISFEGKIIELYPSIFIIEDNEFNSKRHSIQYTELLTRDIVIQEIGEIPEQPKIK